MKQVLLTATLLLSPILFPFFGSTAFGANITKPGSVTLSGNEPKHLRLATLSAFHTSIDATPEGEKYLPIPGPTWKDISRLLNEAGLKEVFDNEPDQAELRVSLNSETEFGQSALLLIVRVTKYVPSEIQLIKGSLPADIWEGEKIFFKKGDGTYDAGKALSKLVAELISDRKKAVENLKKLSDSFKKAK